MYKQKTAFEISNQNHKREINNFLSPDIDPI